MSAIKAWPGHGNRGKPPSEAVAQRLFAFIESECNKSNKYRSGAFPPKTMSVGDVEDFALGYKQHNNKVFLFGSCPAAIRAFEHEAGTEKTLASIGDKKNEPGKKSKYDTNTDIAQVLQPTCIVFHS